MAKSSSQLDSDELAAVGADTADPTLRALEVAIFVEESLDVVLPDLALDAHHLGTPDAVRVPPRHLPGES